MTTTDDVFVRPMCKSDEACLRSWLAIFLQSQLASWAQSLKLNWSDAFIKARLAQTGLIDSEYSELASAGEDPLKFVRISIIDEVAVGVVYAETRIDRYLSEEIGVVSWIFVAPDSRKTGVAKQLMGDALNWMSEKGLLATELFVTNANSAALQLYENVGYMKVDTRMLLPLPNKSSFLLSRTESAK